MEWWSKNSIWQKFHEGVRVHMTHKFVVWRSGQGEPAKIERKLDISRLRRKCKKLHFCCVRAKLTGYSYERENSIHPYWVHAEGIKNDDGNLLLWTHLQ